MSNYKCHFCTTCNGTGCIGQMPGMGGVNRNINFRLNCDGWEVLRKENPLTFINFLEKDEHLRIPQIGLAPMTGAVENIGFESEENYYLEMFQAAHNCKIDICVGDGFPDEKLQFGLNAIQSLQKNDTTFKANFFIKPFEQEKLFDHIKRVLPFAKIIGIDIDSVNISTMKNLIQLEQKTVAQLLEIKDFLHQNKIQFALKGIFTADDLTLLEKVQPDIAYISNHGGRVETKIGSTAEFLQNHAEQIRKTCKQIWVDGGIRTPLDVATAMAFGADKILIGRPFVTAFCKNGLQGLQQKANELCLLQFSR